jgi:LemA protein
MLAPLRRCAHHPRVAAANRGHRSSGYSMIALLVVAFLILALVGYLVGVYNGLVRISAAVKLAWSNIDVLLIQRHDEIPKLVEVCKQYMQYEGGTLERVMKARSGVDAARSSGNLNSLEAAEHEMTAGLNGLYAVAEGYPDLKANEAFRQLQTRVSSLETAISDRREVYNDAATANNIRIRSFPDSLIASMGDFPPAQILHFQSEEKADVDLKALFAR